MRTHKKQRLAKSLSILAVLTMFFSFTNLSFAENPLEIQVNGKIVKDIKPIVKDGTTYLPIRDLGEKLGAEIEYNKDKNRIIVDNERPKIGISQAEDTLENEESISYAYAVYKAGGQPVFLPYLSTEELAEKAIENLDAVIVRGGADIDPALYNEKEHEKLEELDKKRDITDVNLLKACFKLDKPVLGTCRGMQLTNVLCNGTLYQDIITQHPTDIVHRDPEREVFVMHSVNLDKNNILSDAMKTDGKITVNSWHHQAIKDLGDNLEVVALAEDGTIEAIVKKDNTFAVGTQWHPEDLIIRGDENSINLYKTLFKIGKDLRKERMAK